MALIKVIETESTKIAIWQIEEEVEEIKNILDERAIIKNIESNLSNKKRQREQLISHLLVKLIIGEAKEIKHHSNGSPYIDDSENRHISISHSRKSIAVALSKTPIGIDIEEINRKQYQLYKKFTTQSEQKWLEETEDIYTKQLTAAIIWSAKEAIYKLANIEGLLFESEIEITPFNHNTESLFKATYRGKEVSCQLSVIGNQILVISC